MRPCVQKEKGWKEWTRGFPTTWQHGKNTASMYCGYNIAITGEGWIIFWRHVPTMDLYCLATNHQCNKDLLHLVTQKLYLLNVIITYVLLNLVGVDTVCFEVAGMTCFSYMQAMYTYILWSTHRWERLKIAWYISEIKN